MNAKILKNILLYFWATSYLELFNEIWLHFLNFGLILTIGNFQ